MRLEFEPNVTALPFIANEIFEDSAYPASSDLESVLKKGIAAAQAGDRDYARSMLTRASAMDPTCEDSWMWLASISDYPEELLAFLNRVLDINPENSRALEWRTATRALMAKTFVQRAVEAYDEGSAGHAAKFLDQALSHDPGCEMAWFWKGNYATDDEQRASFFGKVLEINPANAEAEAALEALRQSRLQSKFEEAKWAAVAGDREKAMSHVDDFLANVPDHVEAWVFRSHISAGMDDKMHSLKKALEIDPENAAAKSSYEFLVSTFGAPSAPQSAEERQAIEFASQPTAESVVLDEAAEDIVEEAVQAESYQAVPLENEPIAEDAQQQEFVSTESWDESPATDEAVASFHESADEVFQPEAPAPFDGRSTLECEIPAESPEETSAAEEYQAADPSPAFAEFSPSDDTAIEVSAPQEAAAESTFDSWIGQPTDTPQPEVRYEPSNGNGFAEMAESVRPTSETVEYSAASFAHEFAPEPVVEYSAPAFEPAAAAYDSQPSIQTVFLEPAVVETKPTGQPCPFCSSENDAQAFECRACHAVITLSDVESLLSEGRAEREIVQQAVTKMEAEWNLREFTEVEMTALGVGHLNLNNLDAGFKYLQEASRLNPNNVVLASKVNTIAIRLDEIRRQSEAYDAMPKGKTILVVDDSPTVRKLISGKLEKSGHNVVCAVDGVEALERLAENLPDLVLLDITMPRMDGYEVCKQIRSNPNAKNLPVVMISGKDGFFDKVRGRMAGTSGYVTKPFGPETLMKALETYLLPDTTAVN